MNNKNLLIGIGVVVVTYFFWEKNKNKNKNVVNAEKPLIKDDMGTSLINPAPCKKWVQPQCITTPCPPICMEY